MTTSLGTAFLLLDWTIRLVSLATVPHGRSPQAARSWLLLIFLAPIPGLLLLLLIGRASFPRWRKARFLELRPLVERTAESLAGYVAAPVTPAADLVRRLGGWPAVTGAAVELLPDYDDAIARLVADVDAAERSVGVETYIFALDRTGRAVIDALARAAARGVEVRVLIDALGSHRWVRAVAPLLRRSRVEVRLSLPGHLLRRRTRRDMRNHRKLAVIDGEVALIGSQNIVDRDFRPGIVNTELVARVKGPAVAQMAAQFAADWAMEDDRSVESAPPDPPAVPRPAGHAVLQLLPSGADYRLPGFEALLVTMLLRARERVTIATPYLIPDDDLLMAFKIAATRGVEVRVIVSRVMDQWLVGLAQRGYYAELLAAGIRLRAFRPGLLHAKHLVVDDDLGVIGSSNVDVRSFQLNEELSLVLHDRPSVARLAAVQDWCLSQSETIDPARWAARSRGAVAVDGLIRLLSPLL